MRTATEVASESAVQGDSPPVKPIIKAAIASLMCSLVIAAMPLAHDSRATRPTASYPHQSVYRFVNGQWFNGRRFEKRVVYSVNGIFHTKHAGKVDETFDLRGRFVVPPCWSWAGA